MATNPTYANGLKLSTSGEAVSFDLVEGRSQDFALSIYEAADDSLADLSGDSGTWEVRDYEGGTVLATGALSSLAAGGNATLSIPATAFAITRRLGEKVRGLVLSIAVTKDGTEVQVFDDAGNRSFPLRVFWGS